MLQGEEAVHGEKIMEEGDKRIMDEGEENNGEGRLYA